MFVLNTFCSSVSLVHLFIRLADDELRFISLGDELMHNTKRMSDKKGASLESPPVLSEL